MTRYYRRRRPDRGETMAAGALAAGVAVGVGAVTFYLARLFIAREPLGERTRFGERTATGERTASGADAEKDGGASHVP